MPTKDKLLIRNAKISYLKTLRPENKKDKRAYLKLDIP